VVEHGTGVTWNKLRVSPGLPAKRRYECDLDFNFETVCADPAGQVVLLVHLVDAAGSLLPKTGAAPALHCCRYDWDSTLPGAAAVLASMPSLSVSTAARDWLETFVLAKWQVRSFCDTHSYPSSCRSRTAGQVPLEAQIHVALLLPCNKVCRMPSRTIDDGGGGLRQLHNFTAERHSSTIPALSVICQHSWCTWCVIIITALTCSVADPHVCLCCACAVLCLAEHQLPLPRCTLQHSVLHSEGPGVVQRMGNSAQHRQHDVHGSTHGQVRSQHSQQAEPCLLGP
jgi:hypothetical protein